MTLHSILYTSVAAIGILALTATIPTTLRAQAPTVAIDADDIGGVVTGPNGPEAGVWVIAETTDLPTRYTKSVVTDDQGRYVIPDLPTANYQVWVRGYGLVDSPRMRAKPGQVLNHTAIPAPNERAAAHYYPAIYWYTMMKLPPEKDFGGGSDIPKNITFETWRQRMGNVDCVGCHQLGQEATRTIPAQFKTASHEEAWAKRAAAGQAGEMMTNRLAGQLGGVPYKYFGEWTERVAKGELPKNKPSRPQGLERNVVVTTWDWSAPDKYLHDLISSDRRDPKVNAGGKLYGSPEYSTDNMPILDPKTHTVSYFKMPVQDPNMPVSLGPGHAGTRQTHRPLRLLGRAGAVGHAGEQSQRDVRRQRPPVDRGDRARHANPAFCKAGSDHPSAKVFPIETSARQVAMLEPNAMKYSFIDTCFGTHHPQFGYDADNTLWVSGSGQVAGWVNTKVFEETGDAAKAQGWAPFVLDTTGNGQLDAWSDPGKPAEPGKDMRITGGSGPYAVMPHPTDGSVWYTVGVFAGQPGFLRFDPKTKLSEFYQIPKQGIGVRGGDIGKDGVLWGSGSSGDLISFDRRKCKGPLNGPNATGNHCPEGFAFHKYPGPGFEGVENSSAEASYYTWVDHHNAVGLGDNIPISTANLQDGFVALKDGRMVLMRVPYPMGFYAKGMDARIDDPECRLEGPRVVECKRRPHTVAERAWQGCASARGAGPGQAGSAGEVSVAEMKMKGAALPPLFYGFTGWTRAAAGPRRPDCAAPPPAGSISPRRQR